MDELLLNNYFCVGETPGGVNTFLSRFYSSVNKVFSNVTDEISFGRMTIDTKLAAL